MTTESIEQQIRQWLERVVIGLNLCPFAGAPYRNGQVRISVSQAATDESLLAELQPATAAASAALANNPAARSLRPVTPSP